LADPVPTAARENVFVVKCGYVCDNIQKSAAFDGHAAQQFLPDWRIARTPPAPQNVCLGSAPATARCSRSFDFHGNRSSIDN
jgi:hypothetical protein